jgi:hypothetical protein
VINMATDLSALLNNVEEIDTLSDSSQKIRKPHSHAVFVRKALDSSTGHIRVSGLSRLADTGANGKSAIDEFAQKIRSAHAGLHRVETGAGRPGYGIQVQKIGNPQDDDGTVEIHVWAISAGEVPDVAQNPDAVSAENLEDDSAYDQNDPTAEVSRTRRSRRSA